MNLFLKRSLVFLIILFAICYAFQTAIDTGLRHSKFSNFKEWNEIRSGINADLIVMGSSRAWTFISPMSMDSALGTTSYNLGLNGYDFTMQYGRFKVYLEHNKKPSYIIQSLDFNSLRKPGALYMYEQFLPYLDDSIIQRFTTYYQGSFDFKDLYLPLYKYNNNIKVVTAGLVSLAGQKLSTGKIRGFKAQNREWDTSFEAFKKQNPHGLVAEIDSLAKQRFDEYLGYCKSNNIRVVLVYPPEYFECQPLFLNRKSIINTYSTLASKYGFAFLDFSDDPICKSTTYFFNSQHLNVKGVSNFNKALVNKLTGLPENSSP